MSPRRLAALAVAAVLLLGLAVAAVVGDDDGGATAISSGQTLDPTPATDVPTTSTALPSTTAPAGTRPPSTTPTTRDPSGSVSSPVQPSFPATTVPPATGPAPGPCPASDVRVTASTAKSSYAPGEIVQVSSTLENRGAVACLLPTRAFFRILNGAGTDVGGFATTLEFRLPVRAEPGKSFTSTVTWDQKDCSSRPACAPVPAGTYTVVADWTEGGPYSARGTFVVGQ